MKKVGPILTIVIVSIGCILMSYFVWGGNNVIKTLTAKVTESNQISAKEENKKQVKEENKKEPDAEKEPEVVKEVGIPTMEKVVEPTPTPDPVVFDGMTMTDLSAKLDRSLNSTLSGYGSVFASQTVALGLDPYLALAIVLHETGCKWNCSTLLKRCNNVGGMKGSPGCDGGSYKAFPTLEEGIRCYLNNLYYNYYSVGLTTPETIGPKYAESYTWASNINSYIRSIRAV